MGFVTKFHIHVNSILTNEINEIQSVHKHVSINYWSINQRSYQYHLRLFLQWPLQSTQKYNTEVWFQRSCTPAQVSLFIDPLFPLKRPLNVHKNIKAMRISWPLMEGGWGQGKKKIFFLFFLIVHAHSHTLCLPSDVHCKK